MNNNSQLIFRSIIADIGGETSELIENGIIILFGENAPEELKEYCVLIKERKLNGLIKNGDMFKINGFLYSVTDVGDYANVNLDSLGHVTLMINNDTHEEIVGGCIYLSGEEIPELKKEMDIEVWR